MPVTAIKTIADSSNVAHPIDATLLDGKEASEYVIEIDDLTEEDL